MKKLTALVLKTLIITALLINEAKAQQCQEVTGVNGIAGTGHTPGNNVGQSFTACSSGKLATVSAVSGNAPSGFNQVLVEIHAGEGFQGALLGRSGLIQVNANRTVTWDLRSLDITVTEGQKYTAQFLLDRGNAQLKYGTGANTNIDYYPRGRAINLGQSHHDMFFSAVIETLSDPVKSPEDESIAVTRDTEVKLSFSRAMEALTGDITINNTTDATSETIDVTTLTIDGREVLMPLSNPLEGGKDFEIIIPANALRATNGISFPGIASGEWTFSTSTSPYATLTTTSPDLTNDAVIPFSINFSDAVTGFDLSDFVITNGVASNLAGSDDTYTFDVTASADGEIEVSLPPNVVEAGASNGNDSTGYVLAYDGTVPTVSLDTDASGNIQTSVFDIEVIFSEQVVGFESSDLVVTNAEVLSTLNTNDSLFTVGLRALAEGQITVDLPAGIADDLAGNTNTAAPAIIDVTYSVDLESNILSYYPFDGNADDTVSTGFNGTVSGATLTTGFDGTADGAYNFDGSDLITFGDTPIGAGSFTVAFWVKIPEGVAINQSRTLISKRAACGEGRFFEINYVNSSTNGHMITVEQRNNTSVANPIAILSSVGKWMHIAYVKDNDQLQSSLYIDGVQQTPVMWNAVYNFENTANLVVGRSACDGNGRFKMLGDMDNLYVYGRALTGVEIDLLVPFSVKSTTVANGADIQAGHSIGVTFNKNVVASSINTTNITASASTSGAINIDLSATQDGVSIVAPTGWPIDEDVTISLSGLIAENGTNLADTDLTYSVIADDAVGLILHYPISGNVNEAIGDIANQDGTITGALFAEGPDGDSFGALSFDGNDDQVVLGDAPISTESFSYSLLLKVPTDGSETKNTIILSKREVCSEGRMFDLSYQRSGDKFRLVAGMRNNGNVGGVATGFSFPVDEWVKVTFVKDNNTKQNRIIVNGVLEAQSNWLMTSVSVDNNAPIRLGATPCNGVDGTPRFDGLIDDFRIYDRVIEPRVVSIEPSRGTVGAAIDTVVTITFDRAVDVNSLDASIVNFTDNDGTGYAFTTAFSNGDSVLTITPDNDLPKGKEFMVAVDTLLSVVGADFLPFKTSFSTVRSMLLSYSPANGVSDVDSIQTLSFKFDNIMDESSLEAGIKVVGSQSGYIGGSFAMPATDSVVFTPTTPYFPNEIVTVYVTRGLLDQGGAAIEKSKAFSFHVGSPQFVNPTLTFEMTQLTAPGSSGSPRDLVPADVDNDGDLDLIAGDDSPGLLFWYENRGFGNFGPGQIIDSGGSYFDIDVTDFDFDGDLDFVTVNRQTGKGIYWYENNGSGSFTERLITTMPNTSDLRAVKAADFDGDGLMDVAVVDFGQNRIFVYDKNGAELFSAANVGGPIDLQIADSNNDGDMDLYVANHTNGNVALFSNGGSATFGGSALHSASQIRSVIPIDFDKDGDIDIVYAAQTASQIGILENTGSGYTNHQVGSVGGPHRIEVGDIEGDGDYDIIFTVATGASEINFYYLENNGSLGLWVPKKLMDGFFNDPDFTQTAKFADIDNDGDLDVLATDFTNNGLFIFENKIIDLNNGPQVENPIADQSMIEDSATGLTIDVSNVFVDAEGDSFTLEVEVSDPEVTAILNGNDLDITSDQDFYGQVTITLTADDGNGVNTDSFILDVTSVNDTPIFDLSTASITVDEDFTTTETISVTQNQPVNEDAPTYSISPSVSFADVSIDAATGVVSINAVADGFGTQEFTVTADDGGSENNTATQTFILTVNAVNDAPVVANAIADVAFDEDPANAQLVEIGNAFSDMEDAELTYTLNVLSGDELVSVSLNETTVIVAPAANAFGTIQMEVIAADFEGAIVSDQFDIVINPVNDAPSFTTSGDLTVTKNFTSTETVTVTADAIPFGEDSQLVTYSISPSSVTFANVSIDQNTGDVTVTAITDEFGSQEFTITADDGQAENNTASQSFTLTVVDNLAPVVENTISDTNMDEDQATLSIVDVKTLFSDPESDPLTYSVSDDFNGSVTAVLNGNLLEVTPSADFNGSGTVTVSASDANQTASTSFTLTINPINDAPVVNNAPVNQEATEDASFSFTLPADVFTDVDGDVVTISADTRPTWLAFDGSIFTGIPSNSDVGTSTIDLIGSDGNGETATTSFSLTVENVNDAPTVVAPIADVVVDEDAAATTIDLSTVFEDIDAGDQLTLSASAGKNSLVSLVLSGESLEVSYVADASGSITVSVVATDGSGATANDDFVVTINSVNDAPTVEVTLSDQQATEDQAYSFTLPSGLFADVDGDDVTISAGAIPAWLSFDGSIFSGTPTNEDVGVTSVEVIGSDGNGGTATTTFDLTVTNVNDAPTVVAPIDDIVVDEDAAASTISLSNVFEDLDVDDQLTLVASAGKSGLISLVLNGESLEISYTADASGTATVIVTATDLSGLAVSDEFIVTVNSINDAPVFDLSTASVTLEENFTTATTIDILAENVPADEADQTVTYSISSDDAAIVTTTLDGTSIVLTAIAESFGEQTFTITADDGQAENNQHVMTFTVTVNRVLSAKSLENKLSIYPNPVTEYIMIDTDELVNVKFYGLNGQLIKEFNQVNGRVDMSSIKMGTYLMEVSNAKEQITLKINKAN